jgi:hypothetical protein
MKSFFKILAVLILLGLAGCRNLGYNDQSLNNSLTPGISETDYTRTYNSNGTTTVTPTQPASANDPAYPNSASSSAPAPGYSK